MRNLFSGRAFEIAFQLIDNHPGKTKEKTRRQVENWTQIQKRFHTKLVIYDIITAKF